MFSAEIRSVWLFPSIPCLRRLVWLIYSALGFCSHSKFDRMCGDVLITSINETVHHDCLLSVGKVLSLVKKIAIPTEMLVLGPTLRKKLQTFESSVERNTCDGVSSTAMLFGLCSEQKLCTLKDHIS